MAVTEASVSSPQGELERKVLFPDDAPADYTTRITGYIADALVRVPTASDAAVTAWVYYRAFNAVYTRLLALPGRAEFDEGGSYSYLISQMNGLKERAEAWLMQWEDLTSVVVPVVGSSRTGASTSRPAEFYS